jgi:hypothetical protein
MIIATLGTSSKETLDFPGTKDKSKGKQRRRTNDHDSDIEDEAGISDVEEVAGPQLHGWAYVGSHNFTSSAWGTLSGSAFSPTLNVHLLFFSRFVALLTFHCSYLTLRLASSFP